jgi:hypothetical protein
MKNDTKFDTGYNEPLLVKVFILNQKDTVEKYG